MDVRIKVKSGINISNTKAPSSSGTPFLTLKGTCRGKLAEVNLDKETIGRHSLLIGGTGCGKTNLLFQIVDQTLAQMGSDDVMIIFDSKGDYYRQFKNRANAMVIGNSAEYVPVSQKWNIFEEILADGMDRERCRLNAMEIARSLFAQRMQNTTNSFFPSAAQDIFSSLLVSVVRDAERDADTCAHLYNHDLISYLQGSSPQELCAQLSAYPDLRAAVSYIEGGSEQAQGVISEMYSVIRDLFIGVFAQKGSFSMRRFVRSRGKKVLFLEYDLSIGSVLTPVYRLLVDLALQEALSQYNTKGNIFLFFDEFKLLPHLQHIDDAVNFGRSKGVKVFAGLQSIEQLYDIYGQSRGRSIAAGFSTVFAFHANDEATMRYISGRYGQNRLIVETISTNHAVAAAVQNGNVLEDWVLSGLNRGEAVVGLPDAPPFVIRFRRFR